MKASGINVQQSLFSECNNMEEITKKTYPEIRNSFFLEKPNVYDKKYITGSNRGSAIFKTDGYINKKNSTDADIRRIYSEYKINSECISPAEANTQEGSWVTVVSGRRPMGQFSVDSLYSPELHTILELPNIGCKIFLKIDEYMRKLSSSVPN